MTPHRNRPYGLLILLCLAAALFCVVYPLYVIQPFRSQGPRELQAALAVIRIRPFVLGIVLALAVTSAVLWRRRVLGIIGAVAVAGIAALGFINVYELMFHQIARPVFTPAAESKLDGDEKVITIAVGGEARAYPIRSMSYHHILNDVVVGVPIVATY